MRTMLRPLLVVSLVLASSLAAFPAAAADSKDVDSTPQGKVYRASDKAIASGDLKAYQATLASDAVKEMDKVAKDMGKTPKDMMELLQILQPKNVKLGDLKVDGKSATMSMTGKSENETMYGTAELVEENGQWKVRKQSWSNTKP
jgi:Cu/Ag efflux protein CusF